MNGEEQQPRYADNHRHIRTYENFCPICPYCENRNIFNRADDFGTFRPIGHRVVRCQYDNCQRVFQINADLVSSKHEYLIDDCSYLMKEKRYMYVIINLCQACEAYFALFVRAKLIYESVREEIFESLEQINNCNQLLDDALQNHSFHRLRNIFLNLYLAQIDIQSLEDIRNLINSLSNNEYLNKPPRNNLPDIIPAELHEFITRLYDFDINQVRNQVVHGEAYRPDRETAEEYRTQTRLIIFGIDSYLRIDDNIEMYSPPNHRLY